MDIQDYSLFFSLTLENPNLEISRSCVYVHKDLNYKLRDDLMSDQFSSVWLELSKPRQKKILVCMAYRDWQYVKQVDCSSRSVAAQLERWLIFLEQWERAISTGAEIIVSGDMNLNFLKWCDDNYNLRSLSTELFDRILPHGFAQLISVATRVGNNQEASGLDHLYSNSLEKLSDVQVKHKGSSDHKLIYVTRFTRAVISKPRIIRKRAYKHFDQVKYLEAIRSTSWWDVYSCENIEEATQKLSNKLNSILNVLAPIRSIQVCNKYAPWISQVTKEKIKNRDRAQQKAISSQFSEDWLCYKSLRNDVNKSLKLEKIQWQRQKLQCFTKDSKSAWKNVKNWLGWVRTGPPTKLLKNGILSFKPKSLANIMNEFFIEKVAILRDKIPVCEGNPVSLVEEIMKNKSCTFKFRCVHPDETLKFITNLKSTEACGVDNIDSKVIKLAKNELTPVITHIINLSIRSSIFPTQWKTAKVIPLHKKDDVLQPKNYRPVSLLPVLSKILERAIFCQVIEYLELNDILHPSHHGFRQKHNTCTALIQMMDTWVESFEKEDISAVLMLDMSAAFDLVDHSLLTKKLSVYGFDEGSCKWFISYLTQRSQRVCIDGALSDPLEVNIGVPQGSILGPLLYIVYTNDLPETVHEHLLSNCTFLNSECRSCGGICCYADDSTFSTSGKCPKELSYKIAEKYQNIATYMNMNKLVLNSDKTHLLVMASSKKHKKYENFGITLNTGKEIIHPVSSEKLLGSILSNDFTWNLHIRDDAGSMLRKLNIKVNALFILSGVTSFKMRKVVASSLIMSTLTYIIQVYGACSGYLLSSLQVVQNRAARYVTQLPWMTPTSSLLNQCGWLSVRQLVVYHSLLLLHKVRRDKKPRYIYERMGIKKMSNTRQETQRVISGILKDFRCMRTETARKSFIPRSISQWNLLPEELRTTKNLNEFKSKVKEWVRLNIPIK